MNSDGEQTEDSDNSFPCFEAFEFHDGVKVKLDGVNVELAMHANMQADMVCFDSGSNRLVLIDCEGIINYTKVHVRTLGSINSADALRVERVGKFGNCKIAMHVPNASANQLPTDLMSDAECVTSFGKQDGEYYCAIKCFKDTDYDENKVKIIVAIRRNVVWWITRT